MRPREMAFCLENGRGPLETFEQPIKGRGKVSPRALLGRPGRQLHFGVCSRILDRPSRPGSPRVRDWEVDFQFGASHVSRYRQCRASTAIEARTVARRTSPAIDVLSGGLLVSNGGPAAERRRLNGARCPGPLLAVRGEPELIPSERRDLGRQGATEPRFVRGAIEMCGAPDPNGGGT
jgi:hypothetical protein